ncbi:hypothetical protein IB265_33120 [Ensifer sp. ENS10]|uniref:hypothetical protein n=1 Tax=Ensifer sp. ENS10 TaxID=2769286 RepID=UPI001783A1C0|nr:hypothetical protein [Ensifer sp. ENS10]MBD9511600.1 hypothetical protein [Ensifer sp. ENS10]
MSYVTEVFMNRQIAEAATSLEVMQAAQQHKLEPDAKKHALLARVMREHAERFQRLATQQSVMSPDEFFRRAFERVRVMRAEAAQLAKIRREKREQHEAERNQILADMNLVAA